MNRSILILLFIELVFATKTGRHSSIIKKQVRFSEAGSDESLDFNFGEPIKKASITKHSSSSKQSLKSALKPGQIIFSSKQPENDHRKSRGTFNPKSLEKANVFMNSDEGPYTPPNPYRNVGPTPEFLSAVGPERFWIPPNAPMQQDIPGPWLPYYQGVPGSVIYDNRLRVEDAALPQVQGLTGPREPEVIISGPIVPEELSVNGVTRYNTFVPPYRPPCMMTPLVPVTPIPGGNIIDPLSPQVTNVGGPFYPDNLRADGAYLLDADAEEPQLVAQNFEDGPFVVERVVDPIIFFDPALGQTVVFDPLRNFTRLYNPETDPELPISESSSSFVTLNPSQNGASLLKSMSKQPDRPSFWILKRANNFPDSSYKAYEKAGQANMNGQQQITPQSNNRNGASSAASGRVIYQSSPATPIQKIGNLPPKKEIRPSTQVKDSSFKNLNIPQPNQLRIQLPLNPNGLEKSNGNNDKIKASNTTPKARYAVTLVYSPIVDIELGKRYNGFKANKNSAQLAKPSLIILSILFVIPLFLLL